MASNISKIFDLASLRWTSVAKTNKKNGVEGRGSGFWWVYEGENPRVFRIDGVIVDSKS